MFPADPFTLYCFKATELHVFIPKKIRRKELTSDGYFLTFGDLFETKFLKDDPWYTRKELHPYGKKRQCKNCELLRSKLKIEIDNNNNTMIQFKEMKEMIKFKKPMNAITQFVDVGMQFDYTVPVAHNFVNSAYIVGRKSYTIQGSKPQSLDWGEYGFRMHFPRDTIQREEYCDVAVLALMRGDFRLPKDTELVSAVFSISFQKKINQPVGVHMQHCVVLETEWHTTQLCFVATGKSHSKEDNVFDFIEGGQFEIGSQYGCMERMHFCETGIAKISGDSSSTSNDGKVNLTVSYIGCLLYEAKKFNHWLLKFFVHKDIKVYEQFVKEKCNCHKLEVDQKIGFTFVESYIELSLSDSVPDGWRLDPHTEPLKLEKSDVDLFGNSLSSPASCLITIYGEHTPSGTKPLHHAISLNGIKCNVRKIFIIRSLDEICPPSNAASGSLSNSQFSTMTRTYSSQQINDPDSITRIVSTIKNVFTGHEAKLTSLLKPTICEFATEMHQEGLISQAVARDPNVLYTTIIDQFMAVLDFKTEQGEIEEQCLKCLKVLGNIGNKGVSEIIKARLIKEVKTELKIDLNLETIANCSELT